MGNLKDHGSVEHLVAALKDEGPGCVRYSAVFSLGQIGDARTAPALLDVLRTDKDASPRAEAASVLGRWKYSPAIGELLKALQSDQDQLKASAASALGMIDEPAAVDRLLAALQDKDHRVREAAAGALGRLRATIAVVPLIAALDDPQPRVAERAAQSLGRVCDRRAIRRWSALPKRTGPGFRAPP